MIFIKNAQIYSPSKTLKPAGVLIGNGKIKKIFSAGKFNISPGIRVIDAKGMILCPGFIDVHLQGAGGFDFLDGTPQALLAICAALAKFGTTSFLATTVFKNGRNPHLENITRLMDMPKPANMLGVHLEGPFISLNKKGMIRVDGIRSGNLNYLKHILSVTGNSLKMVTIAPETKGALPIIKRLRKKDIIASIGHTDGTFEDTKKAVSLGANHVTHIFNAMRPIHHREPGPLAAILMDERVSVQLIADGVHVHPEMLKLTLKLKGVENIVLITDSMASLGLPDGRYIYDGWEYESKAGACRYKDGTLIGTSLPLNKMAKRMMDYCGLDISEALQMITVNPARVLGVGAKKGSIEEGKDADLVIMDKAFNVFMTMVSGKIVYEKKSGAV